MKYEAKSSGERLDEELDSNLVRRRWYEIAFLGIGKESSLGKYICGLLTVLSAHMRFMIMNFKWDQAALLCHFSLEILTSKWRCAGSWDLWYGYQKRVFFFLEIWCPDAYKKFPSSDPTFDIFYISVPVVLLMKLYFKLPQTSLNKIW